MSLKSIASSLGALVSSRRAAALSLTEDGAKIDADIAKVNKALLPLLAISFIAAGWKGSAAQAVGPIILWCVAVLSSGAMIGFLFGIPRSDLNRVPQNSSKRSMNPRLVA